MSFSFVASTQALYVSWMDCSSVSAANAFEQAADANAKQVTPKVMVNSRIGTPWWYICEAATGSNVRFGSVAVVGVDSSRMAALGWKADIQPGRMSALTDTGRSEALEWPDLNVR